VTAAGGVYTFGNARFYGSLSATYRGAPVRGIALTPGGRGYWLATASGHVYSFGNARYHGSLATSHLATSHLATSHLATSHLATSHLATSHLATSHLATSHLATSHTTVNAIATAAGGHGYWLLSADGTVHGFGAAPNFGSARTVRGVTTSTMAATRDGHGYVLATTGRIPLVTQASARARPLGRKAAQSLVLRPPALSLLGSFLVTCYDLTGITASGEMAGPRSVAVDPSVIPLGTQIYVQGIGFRTADDTGGAIVGDRVDIWEPSYYACASWGAQVRSVYRVSP